MKLAGQIDREGFSKDPSIALEQMMSEFGSVVLRTAYFYMNDRYIAEDISQEVFIRAYRNWTGFRGDSKVKTWLIRITINLCRDRAGLRMNSERPISSEVLEQSLADSVEEEVLKKLNQSIIFKQVLQLSKPYQEALYLHYYLDMNTREISELTGVSEGTIRSRLHRARQQLKEYLRREEGGAWTL